MSTPICVIVGVGEGNGAALGASVLESGDGRRIAGTAVRRQSSQRPCPMRALTLATCPMPPRCRRRSRE
jgi:hypothetical protein